MALFLVLLIKTDYDGQDQLAYPVKIFLDLDLLIFFTSLLSAHKLPAMLFLALLFVPVTLLFGRAFCGWLCPFGSLHHATSFAGKPASAERGVKTVGARWKYIVLLFFIGAALFGLQIAGILDPISFLVRSLSLSILPAINSTLRGFLDWGYSLPSRTISDLFDGLYTFMQAHFLSFHLTLYRQSFLFFLLFVGVLWLNRRRTRFYCRFVCPLGALLGLLSHIGFLRLTMNDKCTQCMKCRNACSGGANPHLKSKWSQSECLTCLNCQAVCPEDALAWNFAFPGKTDDRLNLERRSVLSALSFGAASALVLRVPPALAVPEPTVIRPPGSVVESEFLARCVRCGECMKVCITGGLQPTLFEAGIEGIWTPILVSKIGYCEFNCTLCGQVCPTLAIRKLSLEEKQKTVIGLAFVDPSRCIPFVLGTPCIVCEEHCPTPKKAIVFREHTVAGGVVAQVPVVLPHLCIGCGICENRCPIPDIAAIRVTSAGESRDPRGLLLTAPPNADKVLFPKQPGDSH